MPKAEKRWEAIIAWGLIVLFFLSSCAGVPGAAPVSASSPTLSPPAAASTRAVPAASAPPAASPTLETVFPTHWSVWLSPAVPEGLSSRIHWPENAIETQLSPQADFDLVVQPQNVSAVPAQMPEMPQPRVNIPVEWVYVLTAPFSTVSDGVSLAELQSAWRGEPNKTFGGSPLLMERSTLAAFTALWGEPAADAVKVLAAGQILDAAWEVRPSWAIVPFEQLDPRWKVLRVEQRSPLDKDFDISSYPLTVHFAFRPASQDKVNWSLPPEAQSSLLPANNYDPDKLTVLIMTGVTAMVRGTAFEMEAKGIDYPAQNIGSILRNADITHISNEAPFDENCPPAVPLRREARFCSDPSYLKLLKTVGADVIELTGNHVLDWGPEPFLSTLDLYDQNNLPYYGGGRNTEQARQPLIVEDHGNRIAFIGCDPAGPENILTTAATPGAGRCDYDWMAQAVGELRQQGIVPVVTFQAVEVDDVHPTSAQRHDFPPMAKAGAAIVSGSQSHVAQTMTFEGGSFIHYGLGNLFFDQMEKWQRPAFIDRHVIYDGKYISTELITTMLEDASRPRLMTPAERASLLEKVFEAAGW